MKLKTAGVFALMASLATAVPAAAQSDSMVCDLVGIAKAMSTAQTFLKAGDWTPINAAQKQMIGMLPAFAEAQKRIPEMTGFASYRAEEVNQKLAQAQSPIRLEPWKYNGKSWGAASILGTSAEFLKSGITVINDQGVKTPVTIKGKPAFRIETDDHGISYAKVAGEQRPMSVVSTKSGDKMLFVRSDLRPKDCFELYKRSEAMVNASRSAGPNNYVLGVVVPMVKLEKQPDISWLLGMGAGDGSTIDQAKQSVRFWVDPKKATVKTETAIAATRSFPQPSYEQLDGSFMAVVYRPDVGIIFAGFVGEDSFGIPPSWKG